MLENENETPEVEQESGAEGASPDASSTEGESGEQAKASAPKQEQETVDWSKAFEHPRFKELVDQKNQALSAQKALEQKLAQMETRFTQNQAPSKEQSELDSLIKDLKAVDPRLAAQIEAASKASQTVSQLQQKLEAFEKQSVEQQRASEVQAAVSKVNQLHESNKVSPELKQIINNQLDLLYMQGKLSKDNLEAEYTKAHGAYMKYFDTIKRSERESYVAEKKKDAAVPTSQPKGAPAKAAAKKPDWSKDPEEAKQQIVNRFLKQQKANRESDAV